MLISRWGSGAFHGTETRGLQPKISWDADKECIVLKDTYVHDFNTYAHHDYKISISLEEIADIINVLGLKALLESPDEIDEGLTPAFKALTRLKNLLSGTLSPAAHEPTGAD